MAPKLFSFDKRSIILLFCLMFPSALLPGVVKGQMGGIDPDPGSPGSGGQSTIQGRIYYPSGRTMDKRLRVRLTGLRIGDFFTLTDDSGAFSFRRIAIGSYVISVEAGKEYEPVNETVDIAQLTRTYSLQIQLRLKRVSGNGKSKVIDAAIAAVPKPAVDLYETALATARAGDTKKAIEQLKEALSLHPDFLLALNELGIQYWKTGQLDKAAAVFRSAVKLSPDGFSLRLNYGIVLVHLKRYKDAEPELRHATQVNDGSALAHYYLGRALANSQRYEEAEKELLRALSIGGDEANSAHRYLGAIYNDRGDTKRAIKELETYLKLVPSAKDAEQIREIIRNLKNQK
ncbi:MAG: tetratricopeptide repeat protein [Pyrinomonadaceae bacterium]|nr:tetratricopeptide repeat protein [Pyrinomonadaceae bacterium]